MLIEVMVAILIVTVGIFGLLAGFSDSQKLSLSSERQSAMAHVAQSEIERIEGLNYASVELNSTPSLPSPNNNPNNPDYYLIAGSPPTFEWNRTSTSAEPLVVDTTNGTITPVRSWTQGSVSGSIYDFVTNCSSGCPSSTDNKRITVAVTVTGTGTAVPSPVYVSSVIANPDAGAAQGTAGNPISSGATTCATVTGTTTTQGPCQSPSDVGALNAFFLHDCASTGSSCPAPTASHATHPTVGLVSGLSCTLSVTAGCPTPDKMNPTAPTGSSTSYQYSTDIPPVTGYAGGRLLQPLCATGSICGTGSTSDCNSAAAWTNNLVNAQNEMWVTPTVTTATALTGAGALNLFTETQSGVSAVVTLCLELYEIPPSSGIAGSLANLFAFPPVAIGGAAYVPPTNPSTGSNWPTSPSNVDFEFTFASAGVTVPSGDRVGLRIWMVAETNTNIALLYDSQTYPSEVQLNSQSAIQLSGS